MTLPLGSVPLITLPSPREASARPGASAAAATRTLILFRPSHDSKEHPAMTANESGTVTQLTARVRGLLEQHSDDSRGFCVPNPSTYPHLWFWDSCFHAIVNMMELASLPQDDGLAERARIICSAMDEHLWDEEEHFWSDLAVVGGGLRSGSISATVSWALWSRMTPTRRKRPLPSLRTLPGAADPSDRPTWSTPTRPTIPAPIGADLPGPCPGPGPARPLNARAGQLAGISCRRSRTGESRRRPGPRAGRLAGIRQVDRKAAGRPACRVPSGRGTS